MHTLRELFAELKVSYSPKVCVKEVGTVFDVKSWMSSEIADMSGHIHQHQFKIELNDDGEVVVYYRKWSTDKRWLPEGGITTIDEVPEGKRTREQYINQSSLPDHGYFTFLLKYFEEVCIPFILICFKAWLTCSSFHRWTRNAFSLEKLRCETICRSFWSLINH